MQTGVPTWWESAVNFLEKDDVIGHLVSQYKGESLVGQGCSGVGSISPFKG